MKKIVLSLVLYFLFCKSICVYSQVRKVYSSIETENVLYYKVEEIVNMTFGGSTTRYTVSNLSLISRIEMGPENIRIITPVYKEENYRKKHYIETRNAEANVVREPTKLLEIAIESGKIEIPDNPPIEQRSLALVITKLVKLEDKPVVNLTSTTVVDTTAVSSDAPKAAKKDFILVNVVHVYERVLEKGYKSIFMFKEVANHYYFKNQMEKAAKWYEELFAMTNDLEPIYYFRFGDALRKIGKADEGNSMVEKFNKLME